MYYFLDIMEVLLLYWFIKIEFSQQLSMMFRGNILFICYDYYWIVGDYVDKGKGEKGNIDKCWDNEF